MGAVGASNTVARAVETRQSLQVKSPSEVVDEESFRIFAGSHKSVQDFTNEELYSVRDLVYKYESRQSSSWSNNAANLVYTTDKEIRDRNKEQKFKVGDIVTTTVQGKTVRAVVQNVGQKENGEYQYVLQATAKKAYPLPIISNTTGLKAYKKSR